MLARYARGNIPFASLEHYCTEYDIPDTYRRREIADNRGEKPMSDEKGYIHGFTARVHM